VNKQSGFPSAATVKRHAEAGVQDDTYLIKSPFLSRKGSNVASKPSRSTSVRATPLSKHADGPVGTRSRATSKK
jgi:hypothetical protein